MVDEAEGLVEQPAPDDDRDDGRDHVGKEHEGPHRGPASESPVEQERRGDAEHQLKRGRTRGVDRPLPEAVPELRIADEPDVVAEADPALLRAEGMLVEEGEPDRVADGIEDETDDQDEGGQDAGEPEQGRPPSARPRQRPGGARRGRTGETWHAISSDSRSGPAAPRHASGLWQPPRPRAFP